MKMNLIQRLIRNHRRRAGINETTDIRDEIFATLKAENFIIDDVGSDRQQSSHTPAHPHKANGHIDTLYGVVFYNKWHGGVVSNERYMFHITMDRVCYRVVAKTDTGWMSDRYMTKLATIFARTCFLEAAKKYNETKLSETP